MIQYSTGSLGLCFVFRLQGSVFPKALVWGLPTSMLAFILHAYFREYFQDLGGFDKMWQGYTFSLGFLIVFRNSHGYARFWESATLCGQMRGEWMNAISSVIAFCTQEELKKDKVKEFQHLVVRLMSMLHCQALQQICALQDDSFEILDMNGLDPESLAFLSLADDRCEVLLQWLQRAIIDAHSAGTINVAPPVLSRAFQELSRGMVNLHNVRKIKEIPFPFPYAQMIQVMLMVHTMITPALACHLIDSRAGAVIITLLITSSLWALLYIAREIDHPFGEDKNDFNVGDMQHVVNQSLLTLLHPLAQKAPCAHATDLKLVNSKDHIAGKGNVEKERRSGGKRMMGNFNSFKKTDSEKAVGTAMERRRRGSVHALAALHRSEREPDEEDCDDDSETLSETADFMPAPSIVPGKTKESGVLSNVGARMSARTSPINEISTGLSTTGARSSVGLLSSVQSALTRASSRTSLAQDSLGGSHHASETTLMGRADIGDAEGPELPETWKPVYRELPEGSARRLSDPDRETDPGETEGVSGHGIVHSDRGAACLATL